MEGDLESLQNQTNTSEQNMGQNITDPNFNREKNILGSLNLTLRNMSAEDFLDPASMKFGPMDNGIMLPRVSLVIKKAWYHEMQLSCI